MTMPSGNTQNAYTQTRNLAMQTGMEAKYDQISYGNLILVMFGISIVLFIVSTYLLGRFTELEGMLSLKYTAIGIGVINVFVFSFRITKSIKRRLEIRRLRK